MKRLLKAVVCMDVLFVSSQENCAEEAAFFIREEMEMGGGLPQDIVIEEIHDEAQVPESWKNAIVWNCEELNLNEARPASVIAELRYEKLREELDALEERADKIRLELGSRS